VTTEIQTSNATTEGTSTAGNTVQATGAIAERYEPGAIEPKWQERWNQAGLFRTRADADKPKFYYLDMFPYPSGDLHVGHVRNYAIGDAVARYHVMRGANVLHPMGWDAFGLPAENAAIKNGVHPDAWTQRCIERMHEQFGKLGISFDWDREVTTCRPDYYKWTQWLFLQFYKKGLAVRREATVNWCPNDQTVLANEQVKEGRCERCNHVVEQKLLTQWFFKITDYAQRLLDDLDTLTDWPERVVSMQRNWIGRSEGTTFSFALKDKPDQSIEVFTTRVDTVFGVTYMVLAPDQPLVAQLVKGTEHEAAAEEFRNRVARQKDEQRDGDAKDIPKEGLFTGAYCINPMTDEDVPIWLANYVVSDYGSGAVMAVPAHDQRDWEFAKAYGLPIKVVIAPPDEPGDEDFDMLVDDGAYVEPGVLVNSDDFSGTPSVEAKTKIAEYMEAEGIGQRTVNYRLRDWCLSRQRYWGCPIPVIYCEDGSIETVPEDQLPVLLPTDVKFTGQGGNPLLQSESFINTVDSKGRPARRETDTMDTFVDSSWYFFRFCSPHTDDAPFNRADVEQWMPVDQYVGGIEHATMHLIYARFFTKVLYDMGLSPVNEPFPRLFTQGMVTMYSPAEKKVLKMSKSKGNVVSLDDAVSRYGADATRMMTLFLGPPELDAEWTDQSESTFAGIYRFLERVWRMTQARPFNRDWRGTLDYVALAPADMKLARKTHQTILKVQNDIERFSLNTAISALMEQVNAISDWLNQNKSASELDALKTALYSAAVESLLMCLAPFAPHLSDELLERLGFTHSAYEFSWPEGNEEIAREDEITIPVQVNGKIRTRLQVPVGIDEALLQEQALQHPEVQAHLGGKEPKRVIVVPGRMVNIVI